LVKAPLYKEAWFLPKIEGLSRNQASNNQNKKGQIL